MRGEEEKRRYEKTRIEHGITGEKKRKKVRM